MRIILNDKEIDWSTTESLPILIHGKEGSGASLYTIALAAAFLRQGYKILFLCGYSMAEEEFTKITGKKERDAHFFIINKQDEFKEAFNLIRGKRIVFIKNIELFNEEIFDLVSSENNLIISGDVSTSNLMEKILQKQYKIRIYFSNIGDVILPVLNKYEGFMVSSNEMNGITRLEP